jgi:hypothetical protein
MFSSLVFPPNVYLSDIKILIKQKMFLSPPESDYVRIGRVNSIHYAVHMDHIKYVL